MSELDAVDKVAVWKDVVGLLENVIGKMRVLCSEVHV